MEQNPHIAISPRLGDDFSVEVRHDDWGNWECYYNGNCIEKAAKMINIALLEYPEYPVLTLDWGDKDCPLNGFVFKVRKDLEINCFFKSAKEVRNPFYNRKVYANANPESTVSFRQIGL
jgi:hypothetical protein